MTEIEQLKKWLPKMYRSADQVNSINESDIEILKLKDQYLCVNTDTLSDEILWKLYNEPETIGYIAASGALSDFQGTGNKPLGVTLSSHWAPGTTDEYKKIVMTHFNGVLEKHNVPFLGGDNSMAGSTSLTVNVIGLTNDKPVMRSGAKEGDLIIQTGQMGNGPALALRFLMGRPSEEFPETAYRPEVDFSDAKVLSSIANAFIDSSDGLFTSLYHLAMINNLGAEVNWKDVAVSTEAKKLAEQYQVPEILLSIFEHGDYNGIWAVPEADFNQVKQQLKHSKVIGKFTKNTDVLQYNDMSITLSFNEVMQDLMQFAEAPAEKLKMYIKKFS
jgi:thiamin-phosphate kinase